ncbi:hypothetical protein OQA88_13326 [Cercophora sp. LCS_1]
MAVSLLLSFLCLFLAQAHGFFMTPPGPGRIRVAIAPGPNGGNATFEQYIDHKNKSLGTFQQRYWWNTTFWKGPGSPVFFFTPGEAPAAEYTGYLTNRTMVGQYAQAMGGAVILFEHRYWGESSPYTVLDTKNLTYLNVENSVLDLAHFTKNVKLPFDKSGRSNSDRAPWVMIGGSYSGALAAWTNKLAPDAFWAYHSSSGPVQAVFDFWSYFIPIHRGMPKNCSADLERVADHIDKTIAENNKTEIHNLKDLFGLADLEYHDDFAIAIGSVVNSWQGLQQSSNYSGFFKMCDTIEGVRPVDMGDNNSTTNGTYRLARRFTAKKSVPDIGVGLHEALPNLAAWYKYEYLPDSCSIYGYKEWKDPLSLGCFDTYNETSIGFTDMSLNNTINRQWYWMLCNEPFAYWQVSSPSNHPTFIPRVVKPAYWQRQCDLYFPPKDGATYGSQDGKTTDMLNAFTNGWDLTNTTRLLWSNGEFDPWRSASVSSELRPGGPMESTPEAPVFVLPGGIHCHDLQWRNGEYSPRIRKIQVEMLDIMKNWVDSFYSSGRGKGPDVSYLAKETEKDGNA